MNFVLLHDVGNIILSYLKLGDLINYALVDKYSNIAIKPLIKNRYYRLRFYILKSLELYNLLKYACEEHDLSFISYVSRYHVLNETAAHHLLIEASLYYDTIIIKHLTSVFSFEKHTLISAFENIGTRYKQNADTFDLMKMLYDPHYCYNNLSMMFVRACINGNIDQAKWIKSLDDCDICYNNHQAFKLCCLNGHLHIVEWLCSIESRYSYSISDHRINFHIY